MKDFYAAKKVREIRERIRALDYDIHGMHAVTIEPAAPEYRDEMIALITGHKTSIMIAKHAEPSRQRLRAKEAQDRRGTKQD
ncbi:hypothetical protein [Paracoccus saliphilus]|uniref:Uncharacterized protein n=1 Tax=Paracoccus saliphilus TaxID=405559 RepID=A0AA45W2J5_9RHOB|nr:hypothetical protein [Paracoccus saliphilus]WCR02054.1 hypothetical protein JHX88_14205 [Paracoccus saliphilus]SIS67014.1 hypothetical protein SAMN05421772_102434 [Paracoccus saliphilus]